MVELVHNKAVGVLLFRVVYRPMVLAVVRGWL